DGTLDPAHVPVPRPTSLEHRPSRPDLPGRVPPGRSEPMSAVVRTAPRRADPSQPGSTPRRDLIAESPDRRRHGRSGIGAGNSVKSSEIDGSILAGTPMMVATIGPVLPPGSRV